MIILFECWHCKGAPVPKEITVNGEPRHLVICGLCKRMTLHYYSASLAGAEWNTTQTGIAHKK